MQDTQNSRLYLRPKNDLHKTYQRLKGDDSKHFYQDLLTLMKTSIIENDLKKFRKFAELLEIINKSENNNRLREYFSGGNPLENTNVLLLSCEYGNSEIFSLILANYCNILNLDHTKGCISPVEENSDSNNSYYYLMRLNDVDTLKELIEKWPFALDPMELDTALSKAYVKLILQNVKLEDNMKFYVEFILNKTRLDCNPFGNLDVSMISFDDIKKKSLFTMDVASKLVLDYNNVKSITDDKFIYTVKFLALNLHMLKRLLTCTYDRLPWEEIEFCLVTYVKCFRCKEEQSVYYRSYLKRENILKYLSEFCKEFEKIINGLKATDLKSKKIDTLTRQSVVTEICKNNSTFKELSENFITIRDYCTLRRIVSFLKPALKDKKENETEEQSDQNDVESNEQNYQTDILVIEKCLQILGESLKNTLTTPNLSDEFCNLIFVSFSNELQKVIKEMRNSLSHKYGLRRRVGATDISIYSSENFLRIRKDLSKMYSLISNLLYRIHNKRLQEMFYELQNIKSTDSFEDYKELFNYGEIEFSSMGSIKPEDEYSEITPILEKLKLEILPLKDSTLELLFTKLEDIIQSKSQSYNHTDFDLLRLSTLHMVDYMIESNKYLSRSSFKCLREELGLTNFNFEKSTSLSRQDEHRIILLLEKIKRHALSRYDKSAKNLEMYALQISSFLLISDRKFNSLKEFHFSLKQTKKSKRQDTYLTEILDRKLNQLIFIFKEYDVNESLDSLSNFIAIHGETQIFSAIEMLLLDILSINKDSLKFNMNLYNFVFPTLMGTELRNYLAHGNPVCETLGINMKLSILMNCLVYIKIKSPTSTIITNIGMVPTEDIVQTRFIDYCCLLQSKLNFFKTLESSNMNEGIKKLSIDLLSRNLENQTILQMMTKNTDIEVFKYFWQKVGKDLFNEKEIYERNLLHLAAMNNNYELMQYLFSNIPDIVNLLNDFDCKRKIPLHYAASFGTGDMIRILLENDPEDAITEDKSFHRPIYKSIMNNNVNTFKALLDFTQDMNERYIRGGYTILHYASEQENDEFVKVLCDRNVNVNVKTDKGWTPLHAACFYGRYSIVKILLANGADVNAKMYKDHCTPIFYAIENCHLETVELLLKNGAYTHIVETHAQNNLLHAAAIAGDTNVIDLLIKHNVRIYELSSIKRTVLHFATAERHIDAVKTFLKYDVEVNAQDDFGNTALHIAAEINCKEIIEILLEHQANTEISSFIQGQTPIQIMLTKGNVDILELLDAFNVPFYKKENWEAVVFSGNVDMIKYVFGKCSSDFIMSNWLELNKSFIASIHTNNCDIVKYFVELGADINFEMTSLFDDERLTRISKKLMNEIKILPLHGAIIPGNVDIVLVLLEEYIRLGDTSNCFDIVGEHWDFIASSNNKNAMITILDLFIKHGDLKNHQNKILNGAISNNQIEVVKLLLKNGFKPDSDVIFFSLVKGHSQIAKTLIENCDIDVNAKEMLNMTLLHLAAKNCDSDLVKFLISKGSDVNATDDGGMTPIDYAALTEKGPTIEVLLENNAVFSKSLSIAAENDFIGIVDLLLEKGANVNGSHAQLPPILLAIRYGSQKCIDLIINHPNVDVNIIGDKGFTPLHVASQVGNLEVTKLLINMGANVNIRNTEELTPPHCAAAFGQYKTLKYYIENGYIDIKDELPTCGRTLMHIVTRKNYVQIVNYLISKKIDINVFDNEGFTPLHVAANRSTWEICNILLNSGAIYNVRRFHPFPGLTPCEMANDDTKENFLLLDELFSIVNNNDHFRLEEFIERNNDKINLNAKDINGYTVLHISVKDKLMKIMSILLHHRVNVNVVDFGLNTPLFYAATNNDFEIVKLLLRSGAIYNWKNANDKKPIEMTTDKRMKNMLLTIDKCFKCVETKNEKLLQLIQDVKKREEQITILFGARNNEKQCIYTYIYSKNLEDMKMKLTVSFDLDGQLMRAQAMKLAQMGKYDDAKNILQKLLEKYEQDFGKNNPLTVDIRSDWLGVLYKLNNYKFCLKENEKIIREKTYLYGEKSLTVLDSLDLKALTLHRLGDNDEALKVYKDVCKKQVDLLGEKHEKVIQSKGHMVLVLEALKRYDEALRLNDEVHKIRVETLGEDDPSSLISLNNKALVLNSQGNHLVAMQTYKTVHKKRSKVLGPRHPDTLRAFHNAASCLLQLRRYKEGIKKLEMVYEMQKVEFGENYIDTLNTLQSLSHAYTLKRDAVKANDILTQIYPKINEIYNPDHIALMSMNLQKIMFNPQEAFKVIQEERGRNKKLGLHQIKGIFEAIKMGSLSRMIELVKDPKLLPEMKDEIGASPLHWAVDNNRMDIFLYLLSLKSNPLSLTNNGNSILHTSVNKKNMNMTKAIIERIGKSHKEHFEKFINGKTIKTGKTALHVAVQKDSYEICLYLLQKGVIYNPLTSSNETPQDLAKSDVKNLFFLIHKVFTDVENNNENVLELIKQLPQDKSTACLQCRNAKNQTVLQSAILKRNQKIVKPLIEILKNSGK